MGDLDDASLETKFILGGCHTLLANQSNQLMGDPVEMVFFDNSDWKFDGLNKTSYCSQIKASVRVIRSFKFQSDLKRMSTIARCEFQNTTWNKALVKGAPEVIASLLTNIPENYNECNLELTRKGFRVLALAEKTIDSEANLNGLTRAQVESQLTFRGFYVLDSPLKKDTLANIERLRKANFRFLMITGDHYFTALRVSRELRFGPSESALLLKPTENNDALEWIDEDGKVFVPKNSKELEKHTLCVTGDTLELTSSEKIGKQVFEAIPKITIFARTSPSQKELVVNTLKKDGQSVLMCGDGTNDVGALKQADVGIALVGTRDEMTKEARREKAKELERKKKEMIQKQLRERPFQRPQFNLNDLIAPEDQTITFKAGDACIAAPFTNKFSNSLRCVNVILKQGICTLSSGIQTYRISMLNSIVFAFSMAFLHLDNLKFSETQQILIGVFGIYLFLNFSSGKPVKALPPKMPINSILSPYFVISISLQILIHVGSLVIVYRKVHEYSLE